MAKKRSFRGNENYGLLGKGMRLAGRDLNNRISKVMRLSDELYPRPLPFLSLSKVKLQMTRKVGETRTLSELLSDRVRAPPGRRPKSVSQD
jgi:hypothetical protein